MKTRILTTKAVSCRDDYSKLTVGSRQEEQLLVFTSSQAHQVALSVEHSAKILTQPAPLSSFNDERVSVMQAKQKARRRDRALGQISGPRSEH